MMKGFTFLCLFTFAVLVGTAQRLNTTFLFKPGATLSSDFQPSLSDDGSTIGLWQHKSTLIIPFGGKAHFELGKLKVAYKQHFWNVSSGFTQLDHPSSISTLPMTFSTGITGLRANITGIWLYSAQVGFARDLEVDGARAPYATAGLGRFHLLGLTKWNFYGLALFWNGDVWMPSPIFGMRRKLGKGKHFTMALPLFAEATWKVNDKVGLEIRSSTNGFSSTISTGLQNPQGSHAAVLQYLYINSGVGMSYRVTKKWEVLLQGGWRWPSFLRIEDPDRTEKWLDESLDGSPYARLTMRYDFGLGPFRSHLFSND